MTRIAWVVVGLVGCDGANKGEDLGAHCEDTPTDVTLDEVTALGFAAAEVLARLPATEASTLTWADDTTTALSLAWRPGSAARFVDSEAVYPEDGTAIGVVCDDRVEIDVDWDFVTADGAFAETFASALRATAPDAAALSTELPLDALEGSFDLGDFTETEGERSARIEVTLGDGATSGVLTGQVSGGDPCEEGDTCTAWAENVDIGTWGTDPGR